MEIKVSARLSLLKDEPREESLKTFIDENLPSIANVNDGIIYISAVILKEDLNVISKLLKKIHPLLDTTSTQRVRIKGEADYGGEYIITDEGIFLSFFDGQKEVIPETILRV